LFRSVVRENRRRSSQVGIIKTEQFHKACNWYFRKVLSHLETKMSNDRTKTC
jgi:hypothetical protein